MARRNGTTSAAETRFSGERPEPSWRSYFEGSRPTAAKNSFCAARAFAQLPSPAFSAPSGLEDLLGVEALAPLVGHGRASGRMADSVSRDEVQALSGFVPSCRRSRPTTSIPAFCEALAQRRSEERRRIVDRDRRGPPDGAREGTVPGDRHVARPVRPAAPPLAAAAARTVRAQETGRTTAGLRLDRDRPRAGPGFAPGRIETRTTLSL